MCKALNLKGQRFGKLLVMEKAENHITKGGNKITTWRCKCDCGNEVIVMTNCLKTGNTKSCGCEHIRITKVTNTKHGFSGSPIYNIHNMMKDRCFNKNNKAYRYYGGKGIVVCDEWIDFKKFLHWAINNGYKNGLSIERNDNSKNYCPENCRWITRKEQPLNTSRTKIYEYNGRKMSFTSWCVELRISYKTLKKYLGIYCGDFKNAVGYILNSKNHIERINIIDANN